MIFNPSSLRGYYESSGIEFVLGAKYEENSPMGNIAKNRLAEVISAWLVGLHVQVSPAIPRFLEWLEQAIGQDEDFGESRNFHRMTLYWAKAIGIWMHSDVNAVEVWDKARQFDEAALTLDQNVWPKSLVAKDRLDDYLAFCCQSEQYEIGIAEFQKYHGEKVLSLKRVLKPREFGYALCLHKANKQFDETTLFEAGRRMLQSYLEDAWLGRGQYIRAATWLKIVYWHRDPTITPLQTVLKAYDNMPNVRRPEFMTG